MSTHTMHSSKPNEWVLPRPHTDAHQRLQTYGPIQSMHEPSWFERLFFGRR